ncbi:MAG: hypothetical protein LBS31_07605 [Candidatus Adiutrix sp.]|jgi:putative intracellular protease/amidase|nr:hypothetical protein [Candidatus Adiutrix sp.]
MLHADGFEEIEGITQFDYLRRAGISGNVVAAICASPADKSKRLLNPSLRSVASLRGDRFLKIFAYTRELLTVSP